jgi:hypothetical protein
MADGPGAEGFDNAPAGGAIEGEVDFGGVECGGIEPKVVSLVSIDWIEWPGPREVAPARTAIRSPNGLT